MNVILYLVKFFTAEEHADAFQRGSLYMNRLSYFKELEAEDGRPDSKEAVWIWQQPKGFRIEFEVPSLGKLNITENDLAGPVTVSPSFFDNLHIFCVTALRADIPDPVEGKKDFTHEDVEALKGQFKINPQCLRFGEFAVVFRYGEFMERVSAAVKAKKLGGSFGLVRYFDGSTFSGQFAFKDVPFMKEQAFAYQSEFRLTVDTGVEGKDAMTLEIGDLSDISAKIPSADINETFRTIKFLNTEGEELT